MHQPESDTESDTELELELEEQDALCNCSFNPNDVTDVDSCILAAATEDNVMELEEILVDGNKYVNINVKTPLVLDTPLLLAAKNNSVAMVEALLRNKNTHVNSQNAMGDTALHVALRHNYTTVASAILRDWRTCANVTNNNNETPAHLVCTKGNVELYALLETFRNVKLDERDILNFTPLMYVLLKLYERNSSTQLAYYYLLGRLLHRGARLEIPDMLEDVAVLYPFFITHPRVDVNTVVIHHRDTLFGYCCSTGNVDMFEALRHVPGFKWPHFITNLLMTVRRGHVALTVAMLRARKIKWHKLHLLLANMFRYVVYVDDLVTLLNCLRQKHLTVEHILIKAVYFKRCDIINKYLLEQPEAVTDKMVIYIMTHLKIMFYAIVDHHHKLLLLNAHMHDTHGNGLLSLAVQFNYSGAMIIKLLRLGADPNQVNFYNQKALHFAISDNGSHFDIEIMNILLPVTQLTPPEIFNMLNFYMFINKTLMVRLFKNMDWNGVYGAGLRNMPLFPYILLLEFFKTLHPRGQLRHAMLLSLLGGSHECYLAVQTALQGITLLHSHNTTDIVSLDDINPCGRLNIVQYGRPIQQKYRTLTHDSLVQLVIFEEKNHRHYHSLKEIKDLTDPFDRSILCDNTVVTTGLPLMIDCLVRALLKV